MFFDKKGTSFIVAGVDRKSKVFICKGGIFSGNLEVKQFVESEVRNGKVLGLGKELRI